MGQNCSGTGLERGARRAAARDRCAACGRTPLGGAREGCARADRVSSAAHCYEAVQAGLALPTILQDHAAKPSAGNSIFLPALNQRRPFIALPATRDVCAPIESLILMPTRR